MERIRAAFERLRRARRKALIPFVMGGDPTLRVTRDLVRALAEAGADLVEIGMPFSDPLADGPVIQRASGRALAGGATPQAILRLIAQMRRTLRIPVVLLSYWNPVMQYGGGRARAGDPIPFIRDAAHAGASGLIVPDLPPEEAEGLPQAGSRFGLETVFLAAPTSPPERLRRIARASRGFIYYVSVTGTTGARARLPREWLQGVRQLRLITTTPICVGFGISTPAQAKMVARAADGVIVGSALLRTIEPHLRHPAALTKRAAAFLRALRRSV
ncbi:MAG: tryptophan synthase subunit alpha [Candidatus Omnitrophica bacterium]|nr:tryptophan synthase subunit alpha [Candidatus Omnitrophota bacterium]